MLVCREEHVSVGVREKDQERIGGGRSVQRTAESFLRGGGGAELCQIFHLLFCVADHHGVVEALEQHSLQNPEAPENKKNEEKEAREKTRAEGFRFPQQIYTPLREA